MLTLNSKGFSLERGLELSTDELISRASSLGELLHWDFGPVMTMRFDPGAQNYLFSDEAVPFHWDGAFYKEPRFLLFYCLESLGSGGETIFSDTTALWETLTEEEKAICRGVTLTYKTEKKAHYGGEITVPLVQTHPVTGGTILRLAERVETEKNPVTLKIHGTSEDFFLSLVKRLHQGAHAHRWEKGDLLLIDNFRFLHGRRPLGENKRRSFQRIQILKENV